MNILKLSLIKVALLCLFAYSSNAQSAQAFHGGIAFVAAPTPMPKGKSTTRNTSIYRVAKKLSYIYSGYAIEIASSNLPLDKYHPVFKQFGNVFYHKLKAGGYSYMILAEFSSDESALDFLRNIIQPRVSTAKLYQYKDGNRKLIGQ